MYDGLLVRRLASRRVIGMYREIQLLGPADVRPMRQLLHLFGRAFEERETYSSRQPTDEYLRQLLNSNSFVVIAALAQDGEVIGGLAGYVLPKFEQERCEFYLYDLAVEEAYRRQGIATALLDELCRLAQRRDIYLVFVQADKGDDPALRMYAKFGSKSPVLQFDIDPVNGGA
ncbi:MAG: GNAT family N-acetyltransferase [Pirellulales bacterium]